jgi:hypothetical protein
MDKAGRGVQGSASRKGCDATLSNSWVKGQECGERYLACEGILMHHE